MNFSSSLYDFPYCSELYQFWIFVCWSADKAIYGSLCTWKYIHIFKASLNVDFTWSFLLHLLSPRALRNQLDPSLLCCFGHLWTVKEKKTVKPYDCKILVASLHKRGCILLPKKTPKKTKENSTREYLKFDKPATSSGCCWPRQMKERPLSFRNLPTKAKTHADKQTCRLLMTQTVHLWQLSSPNLYFFCFVTCSKKCWEKKNGTKEHFNQKFYEVIFLFVNTVKYYL